MEGRSAARGRRSRSLSRFPPPPPGSGEFETPRSRFVNKVRGSGQGLFPDASRGEVSLDDLADEFLRARAESEDDDDESEVFVRRGRAETRTSFSNNTHSSNKGSSESSSGASYLRATASSKQRGRSVSRPPAVQRNHQSVGPSRARQDEANVSHVYNNSKPTIRKASTSTSGPTRQNQLQKQTNSNRVMSRSRSMSRKNSFHSRDSCSTHSSLTDDEARDIQRNGRKEHAVSEGEAGIYQVMRMEVRNAVEEIKTQLENVMTKTETADNNNNNKTGGVDENEIQPIQVIAELRRNYTSKLEESEKRKQDLLAELAAEEQRGNELTKIVKELLPSPQKNLSIERPSRNRRRSRERTRVSRHLTEEAERYFEDFISNVDDTDFSSFDGERSSDTSFNPKPNLQNNHLISPNPNPNYSLQELQQSPVINNNNNNNSNNNNDNSENEADGVVLPWLQWETSPSPSKTLKQDGSGKSNRVTSSHDSWSPENRSKSVGSFSTNKSISKFGEINKINKVSSYCKDDYLDLRNSEDLLFERLRHRQRIESGCLVLCKRIIL